jgi:putative transposase
MPKSYSCVWIHAVWSTKNRQPLIHPTIEKQLFDLIRSELEKCGCIVRNVNGMPDHVHCLFGMNPKIAVTDVIKQVKGSSSFHINQHNALHEKLVWQRGFGIFGVSHSAADNVYRYIRDQKIHLHHRDT